MPLIAEAFCTHPQLHLEPSVRADRRCRECSHGPAAFRLFMTEVLTGGSSFEEFYCSHHHAFARLRYLNIEAALLQ